MEVSRRAWKSQFVLDGRRDLQTQRLVFQVRMSYIYYKLQVLHTEVHIHREDMGCIPQMHTFPPEAT